MRPSASTSSSKTPQYMQHEIAAVFQRFQECESEIQAKEEKKHAEIARIKRAAEASTGHLWTAAIHASTNSTIKKLEEEIRELEAERYGCVSKISKLQEYVEQRVQEAGRDVTAKAKVQPFASDAFLALQKAQQAKIRLEQLQAFADACVGALAETDKQKKAEILERSVFTELHTQPGAQAFHAQFVSDVAIEPVGDHEGCKAGAEGLGAVFEALKRPRNFAASAKTGFLRHWEAKPNQTALELMVKDQNFHISSIEIYDGFSATPIKKFSRTHDAHTGDQQIYLHVSHDANGKPVYRVLEKAPTPGTTPAPFWIETVNKILKEANMILTGVGVDNWSTERDKTVEKMQSAIRILKEVSQTYDVALQLKILEESIAVLNRQDVNPMSSGGLVTPVVAVNMALVPEAYTEINTALQVACDKLNLEVPATATGGAAATSRRGREVNDLAEAIAGLQTAIDSLSAMAPASPTAREQCEALEAIRTTLAGFVTPTSVPYSHDLNAAITTALAAITKIHEKFKQDPIPEKEITAGEILDASISPEAGKAIVMEDLVMAAVDVTTQNELANFNDRISEIQNAVLGTTAPAQPPRAMLLEYLLQFYTTTSPSNILPNAAALEALKSSGDVRRELLSHRTEQLAEIDAAIRAAVGSATTLQYLHAAKILLEKSDFLVALVEVMQRFGLNSADSIEAISLTQAGAKNKKHIEKHKEFRELLEACRKKDYPAILRHFSCAFETTHSIDQVLGVDLVVHTFGRGVRSPERILLDQQVAELKELAGSSTDRAAAVTAAEEAADMLLEAQQFAARSANKVAAEANPAQLTTAETTRDAALAAINTRAASIDPETLFDRHTAAVAGLAAAEAGLALKQNALNAATTCAGNLPRVRTEHALKIQERNAEIDRLANDYLAAEAGSHRAKIGLLQAEIAALEIQHDAACARVITLQAALATRKEQGQLFTQKREQYAELEAESRRLDPILHAAQAASVSALSQFVNRYEYDTSRFGAAGWKEKSLREIVEAVLRKGASLETDAAKGWWVKPAYKAMLQACIDALLEKDPVDFRLQELREYLSGLNSVPNEFGSERGGSKLDNCYEGYLSAHQTFLETKNLQRKNNEALRETNAEIAALEARAMAVAAGTEPATPEALAMATAEKGEHQRELEERRQALTSLEAEEQRIAEQVGRTLADARQERMPDTTTLATELGSICSGAELSTVLADLSAGARDATHSSAFVTVFTGSPLVSTNQAELLRLSDLRVELEVLEARERVAEWADNTSTGDYAGSRLHEVNLAKEAKNNAQAAADQAQKALLIGQMQAEIATANVARINAIQKADEVAQIALQAQQKFAALHPSEPNYASHKGNAEQALQAAQQAKDFVDMIEERIRDAKAKLVVAQEVRLKIDGSASTTELANIARHREAVKALFAPAVGGGPNLAEIAESLTTSKGAATVARDAIPAAVAAPAPTKSLVMVLEERAEALKKAANDDTFSRLSVTPETASLEIAADIVRDFNRWESTAAYHARAMAAKADPALYSFTDAQRALIEALFRLARENGKPEITVEQVAAFVRQLSTGVEVLAPPSASAATAPTTATPSVQDTAEETNEVACALRFLKHTTYPLDAHDAPTNQVKIEVGSNPAKTASVPATSGSILFTDTTRTNALIFLGAFMRAIGKEPTPFTPSASASASAATSSPPPPSDCAFTKPDSNQDGGNNEIYTSAALTTPASYEGENALRAALSKISPLSISQDLLRAVSNPPALTAFIKKLCDPHFTPPIFSFYGSPEKVQAINLKNAIEHCDSKNDVAMLAELCEIYSLLRAKPKNKEAFNKQVHGQFEDIDPARVDFSQFTEEEEKKKAKEIFEKNRQLAQARFAAVHQEFWGVQEAPRMQTIAKAILAHAKVEYNRDGEVVTTLKHKGEEIHIVQKESAFVMKDISGILAKTKEEIKEKEKTVHPDTIKKDNALKVAMHYLSTAHAFWETLKANGIKPATDGKYHIDVSMHVDDKDETGKEVRQRAFRILHTAFEIPPFSTYIHVNYKSGDPTHPNLSTPELEEIAKSLSDVSSEHDPADKKALEHIYGFMKEKGLAEVELETDPQKKQRSVYKRGEKDDKIVSKVIDKDLEATHQKMMELHRVDKEFEAAPADEKAAAAQSLRSALDKVKDRLAPEVANSYEEKLAAHAEESRRCGAAFAGG